MVEYRQCHRCGEWENELTMLKVETKPFSKDYIYYCKKCRVKMDKFCNDTYHKRLGSSIKGREILYKKRR